MQLSTFEWSSGSYPSAAPVHVGGVVGTSGLDWAADITGGAADFCSSKTLDDQSEDMKVLGVDLDALMHHGNTGYGLIPPLISSSYPDMGITDRDEEASIAMSSSPTTIPMAPGSYRSSSSSSTFSSPSSSPPQQQNHPLMACHDYTNKVSYTMARFAAAVSASVAASTNTTTKTSTSPPKPPKATVMKTRSKTQGHKKASGTSTGSRTAATKPPRVPKANIEDKDYLAHGTGIPRHV